MLSFSFLFFIILLKNCIIYLSVISCKDPGSPLHGRQSNVKKNFTVGGIVRFKCSENYTMVGRGRLTCLKSKKWNGEIPKCLGKPFNCTILF